MNNHLKQLIRELENAAGKCGEDEYRASTVWDGAYDRSVFRHADQLTTARCNLEEAIDALCGSLEECTNLLQVASLAGNSLSKSPVRLKALVALAEVQP